MSKVSPKSLAGRIISLIYSSGKPVTIDFIAKSLSLHRVWLQNTVRTLIDEGLLVKESSKYGAAPTITLSPSCWRERGMEGFSINQVAPALTRTWESTKRDVRRYPVVEMSYVLG